MADGRATDFFFVKIGVSPIKVLIRPENGNHEISTLKIFIWEDPV
jgi:hypothetical protein